MIDFEVDLDGKRFLWQVLFFKIFFLFPSLCFSHFLFKCKFYEKGAFASEKFVDNCGIYIGLGNLQTAIY